MYIKTKIALLIAGLCMSAVFVSYHFSFLRNSQIAEARASGYPIILDGTDVSAFGVKYDVTLAQGMINGGSNRFRTTGAAIFSSADVRKDVIVYYRGYGPTKRFVKGNVWTGCIARVDTPTAMAIRNWAGNFFVPSTFPLPALKDMLHVP